MDLKTALFGKGRALGRPLIAPQALIDLTGNLQAAHVLSQVGFRWFANGRKKFYKFNAPCDHDWYRPGDSWTEELRMGKDAFMRARARVAVKVTTGTSKREARENEQALVIYWTDSNRVTWYELNERLLMRLLKRFLRVDKSDDQRPTTDDQPIYLEERGTRFTSSANPTPNNRDEDSGIGDNSPDVDIKGNGWWQRALMDLSGQVTRATYERLFHGSEARQEQAGAVVVTVKDRGAVDLLRRHRERVRRAIEGTGLSVGEVAFVTR